jgi:retron-type reverse transcriptase
MALKTYYERLRSISTLRTAWRHVCSNGSTSRRKETRDSIKDFSENAENHLKCIQTHLREKRFKFAPAEGIPFAKPGKKKKRPVVRFPVESSIVQRSLLEILIKHPDVHEYIFTPSSFGGIPKRGVSHAMKLVVSSIASGAKYYLRSDIAGFFTKIPRDTVHRKFRSWIGDNDFLDLLKKATETELSNMAELGDFAKEFPLDDVGVAQGCCLSPLIGNILLFDFDRQMNGRNITCVRFMDDFLLLGSNRKSVLRAFHSACLMLSKYGLTAYDPRANSEKAKEGVISGGFDFLGCQVKPESVLPGRKACENLIKSVDECIKNGKTNMQWCAGGKPNVRYGLMQTLLDLNHIIQGWSHAYKFCNPGAVFSSLDRKVDSRINSILDTYYRLIRKSGSSDRRRLLGIHLIQDTPFEPVLFHQHHPPGGGDFTGAAAKS